MLLCAISPSALPCRTEPLQLCLMISVLKNWHIWRWFPPWFTSLPVTSLWKKLRIPGWDHIILTTQLACGHRQQGGVPFNACEFQSKGDPITDLFEDLAAEQKARSTYDNILRVVRNIPEVLILSVSCVQGKWYISSDLVKHFAPSRNSWMLKTSTLSIQALTIPALQAVHLKQNSICCWS